MSVQTAGTGFERHSTTASRRGPLRREPAGAPDALPPRDASLLQALTIVAHDLRGPLANLSVMLELIEAYTLRQSVGEAQGCARRAQRLVGLLDEMLGGFLERTRTTGDPLAFRPRLLDLSDVLDRALSLSSPVATGRGITLERLGGTSVTLSGDRSLLVEAVDNILGNAVKYAPVGSTVRCVVGREGRDAVIRVFDAGPGFGDGELQRLFRPFTKLSRKCSERCPSTGLGLWIARLVATRHGGSLTALPRGDGPGTVFTIRLPAGL